MALCSETPRSENIDPSLLRTALVEARVYSNKIYGSDCLVCAEVMLSDASAVELHITSPIKDMFINTSATITVRASDGQVTDKAQYHSCHARITSKPN
jgi:hypothetical protein